MLKPAFIARVFVLNINRPIFNRPKHELLILMWNNLILCLISKFAI